MLLIYGIMGIAGALAFLIFVKSRPPTPTRAAEIYTEVSNWGGIRNILKMRNFVILGFIAMVGIGVFNGLATWLEKILHDLHGISMTDAGSISALLILSGMVGCIIVPIISDKIRRRKLFIILTSAVGMICVSVLMFANGYDLNLANGILMGFFLISALPIMLTMSAEITGPRYAGVSVGYLQLLGNAAAVIIVSVMESLSAATGNFIAPLALLAVLLLGSLVMSILIRDTHPGAGDVNK
jgi:cyanate permease